MGPREVDRELLVRGSHSTPPHLQRRPARCWAGETPYEEDGNDIVTKKKKH